MKLFILILVVCLVLPDVNAWWWGRRRRRSSSCGSRLYVRSTVKVIYGRENLRKNEKPDKQRGKPYYFGKTKLFCMRKVGKKGKRAPSRFEWSLSHRWIYYDGLYYEFGIGSAKDYHVATRPVLGRRCRARREGYPAGYGVISRECLKKCAQRYKGKYGSYRLFKNNCHTFANRMSNILCNSNRCPSWCS